jgi:formylglycine-generating enzyme required for sulfatase activity
MADVFVSYAREDLERVEPIVGAIEDAGYSVFWDRDVPPGLTWRQYIGKALDEAKCVIVVWSTYSIDSKFVIEEADDGNEREILVPVLIDEVRPPLGFRSIQHEDFREWAGDPENRRVKSLLDAIERIAGELPRPETPFSEPEKPKASTPSTGRSAIFQLHDAQTVITNEADGYELVKIPAGTFMMGSPEDEEGRDEYEGPRHKVHVQAFLMGRYPVTNAQYQKFLEANPKTSEPEYWADRKFNQPQQPVVGVSCKDAKAYARWAGLRLPSEAEWEYACRAGTTTRFSSGDADKDLDAVGWYDGNSEGRLHPVGEKAPNGFSLYDMHGNIDEWLEDDWHDNYDGAPTDGSAWLDDPRGTDRVIRGGCWYDGARLCRSAGRDRGGPGYRSRGRLGFRLSRSIASSP